MNQDLKQRLYDYFSAVENPTDTEKLLLLEIEGDLPYFQVTSVHRDDLFDAGYNGALADDSQMNTIADKLSDDYCEQLFWGSLDIIANHVGIPALEIKCCPKCETKAMNYDVETKTFRCTACNHTWLDPEEEKNEEEE